MSTTEARFASLFHLSDSVCSGRCTTVWTSDDSKVEITTCGARRDRIAVGLGTRSRSYSLYALVLTRYTHTDNGDVVVLDAATTKLVSRLNVSPCDVTRVLFAPGESLMATSSDGLVTTCAFSVDNELEIDCVCNANDCLIDAGTLETGDAWAKSAAESVYVFNASDGSSVASMVNYCFTAGTPGEYILSVDPPRWLNNDGEEETRKDTKRARVESSVSVLCGAHDGSLTLESFGMSSKTAAVIAELPKIHETTIECVAVGSKRCVTVDDDGVVVLWKPGRLV